MSALPEGSPPAWHVLSQPGALLLQVFVYKREAVLYKYVRKGSPAATPWFVMLKDGKRWKCIARQQTRPNAENLEAAFYNASAAESPINKGVQFLKGLTGKP